MIIASHPEVSENQRALVLNEIKSEHQEIYFPSSSVLVDTDPLDEQVLGEKRARIAVSSGNQPLSFSQVPSQKGVITNFLEDASSSPPFNLFPGIDTGISEKIISPSSEVNWIDPTIKRPETFIGRRDLTDALECFIGERAPLEVFSMLHLSEVVELMNTYPILPSTENFSTEKNAKHIGVITKSFLFSKRTKNDCVDCSTEQKNPSQFPEINGLEKLAKDARFLEIKESVRHVSYKPEETLELFRTHCPGCHESKESK